MSLAYKVLGQNSPSATTNTTLYTCPAQKQAVVSSIVVVNRNASGGTYRTYVYAKDKNGTYLIQEIRIEKNQALKRYNL